jgi:hypothetical protein
MIQALPYYSVCKRNKSIGPKERPHITFKIISREKGGQKGGLAGGKAGRLLCLCVTKHCDSMKYLACYLLLLNPVTSVTVV